MELQAEETGLDLSAPSMAAAATALLLLWLIVVGAERLKKKHDWMMAGPTC